MSVSLYYREFSDHFPVAHQLQEQSKEHLWGVINYLYTAKESMEKKQTIAKVRWKEVKQKKIMYFLYSINCWVEMKWEPRYRVLDWALEEQFLEDIIGINIPPYSLKIVPSGKGKPSFVPQEEEDWEILEMIVQQSQAINTPQGRKKIALEECPSPPDHVQSGNGKKIEVEKCQEITNGFRLLLKPKVQPDDLHGLTFDDAPSDMSIRYHGNEYPRDLRFSDNDGNFYNLTSVDNKFQVDKGKIKSKFLKAHNEIQYKVKKAGVAHERKGFEVELGEAEMDEREASSATIDPRYYFFDQDIKEVWLKEFVYQSDKKNKIRVFRKNDDSFHIWLERLPDPETELYFYLPKNLANIQHQINAAEHLREMPLQHHRNLLRLFENPVKSKKFWPGITRRTHLEEKDWCFLTDSEKNGTDQQREFVEIAIDTPDFAFLEGPPGSGKTTALAELVYQLCLKNKKILMVSNTHYAIDNVLEKIIDEEVSKEVISPIRIGSDKDRVDRQVREFYLDNVAEIIRKKTGLNEKEAAVLSLETANLVCGTSTGLGADPRMKLVKGKPAPKLYDYLIIDESSKSTFQEFLYPALFAERWVLAGDVRQLSPYTEEKELVANVENLKCMNREHQRALLILFRLASYRKKWKEGVHINNPFPEERWLIVEDPPVLEYLIFELEKRLEMDGDNEGNEIKGNGLPGLVVYIKSEYDSSPRGAIVYLRPEEVVEQGDKGIFLHCADWVLVDPDCLYIVQQYLPPTLMPIDEISNNQFLARSRYWMKDGESTRKLKEGFWDRGRTYTTYWELQENMQKFFKKYLWSEEWVWRVKRINELKLMDENRKKEEIIREVNFLSPTTGRKGTDSTVMIEKLDDVRAIAFPSILESLQEGIPVDRRSRRVSFLSTGFKEASPEIWNSRHILLEYQHRMEETISKIPRDCFYRGEALKDANTIIGRRVNIGFTFPEDEQIPILGWKQVVGKENKGRNHEEAREIILFLDCLEKWARQNPPHSTEKQYWNVAVLTFYLGQESLLVDELRKWTHQDQRKSRFEKGNLRLIVGTIDRFQGREADVVLLSIRNTHRMGFLDSMNRMNVGITRARYQLILFGNKRWFGGYGCKVDAWKKLAGSAKDFSIRRG